MQSLPVVLTLIVKYLFVLEKGSQPLTVSAFINMIYHVLNMEKKRNNHISPFNCNVVLWNISFAALATVTSYYWLLICNKITWLMEENKWIFNGNDHQLPLCISFFIFLQEFQWEEYFKVTLHRPVMVSYLLTLLRLCISCCLLM